MKSWKSKDHGKIKVMAFREILGVVHQHLKISPGLSIHMNIFFHLNLQ